MLRNSRISHGPSVAGDEQKSDSEQRAYDVHIKRNTRVARREVPRHDHLSDVPYGVTEQEDRGGADRPRFEAQIAPKAMQAVAPMAKSAIPTSNWKWLTCQPMSAAAVAVRKT
jgi:hypothetical protein